MRATLFALTPLLIAASILLAGNGLQNTLLAVRANLEGFSLIQIGLLLSTYFGGYIVGCWLTPMFVARVGHIRTFTALASIASAAALCHVLLVSPVAWMLLRALSGVCLAGLTMIIESWMNEKAPPDKRGRVLAIYRITDFSALMCGQLLLTLASPAGFALFALVSILISLALVPVALSTANAPQPVTSTKLRIGRLWKTAPVAAGGALVIGITGGAFWALAPVYVQQLGYGTDVIATVMSLAILGGALAQWPVGYISDFVDRRKMLVVIAVTSSVFAVLLVRFGDLGPMWLMSLAFVYGAASMPVFGVSAAHANDLAEPGEFVEISGGLLTLYGVGAMVGPMAAAQLMESMGPGGLFLVNSIVFIGFAVAADRRIRRVADVAFSDKHAYVAVPRTSPTVFDIDPRTHEVNDSHNTSATIDDELWTAAASTRKTPPTD